MSLVEGIDDLMEAEKPLTTREARDIARANVWLMDIEMDGWKLPEKVQRVTELRRRLTPDEQRVILDYFYNNAPGNFS